jgi:Kef-type K+ transport system membrane component KefB
MTTNLFLAIGVMIILGLMGGSVASKLRLPRITGYIVVGMLLSPSLFHLVPKSSLTALDPYVEIALSLIGYSIGGNLRFDAVRQWWRPIMGMTLLQGFGSWFLSTLVISLLGPFILNLPDGTLQDTYFPVAFILGAISWATAPAVTLAILHECKAKGSIATILLAVVVVTDAFAVIAFYFAEGMTRPLLSGSGIVSFYQIAMFPVLQVLEAAGMGVVFGFAIAFSTATVHSRSLLILAIVGTVFLCQAVADSVGTSSILAAMFAGFVAINKSRRDDLILVIEEIEDVIFVPFFVISGMYFDLDIMKVGTLLTFVIIFTRCLGKYLGTYAGAALTGAPDVFKKYLGFALLPKAGLTIGLAFLARNISPRFGDILFNALLASTAINMLFTPPLARFSIQKAAGRAEEIGFNHGSPTKTGGL